MSQHWKYEQITIQRADFTSHSKKMDAEGWELVATMSSLTLPYETLTWRKKARRP